MVLAVVAGIGYQVPKGLQRVSLPDCRKELAVVRMGSTIDYPREEQVRLGVADRRELGEAAFA